LGGEHIPQDFLEGHDMAADTPGAKKMTLTIPVASVKRNFVLIVIAFKCGS